MSNVYSDGSLKRLRDMNFYSVVGGFTLTDDDLRLARAKIQPIKKRSVALMQLKSRIREPRFSSSPDVLKVSACKNPMWVEVRCFHGNTTHIRVRCRKCSGCHHAWRNKVRHLILDGALGKVWMWTLTIPEQRRNIREKNYSKEDLFDVIQTRWHALLRRAQKQGLQFDYFRVTELQRRGTPHFHIACKNFTYRNDTLSDTKKIYRMLRRLQKAVGFGFNAGKTTDFTSARLGARGCASYMSKYLSKQGEYNELRRDNGRAIRRYCRSRHWFYRENVPNFRFSSVGSGVKKTYQTECELPCFCGEKKLLNRDNQITKWLKAVRKERSWVAPMTVLDHILNTEREEQERWQN